MDPSKRICLKNLPDNVTKREIAELVRNRTGAQPHSIDLGLDAEGNIRHYAHFSCEGAKNVLEVLQHGVAMRDQTVYGFPAKPHYSFALAEARRKREREEETEKEQLNARLEAVKARALERTHGGELSKTRMPKPTAFSVKPKYGTVASDLAKKYRDAYRQQHGKPALPSAGTTHGSGHRDTAAAAAAATAGHAQEPPAAAGGVSMKRGAHKKNAHAPGGKHTGPPHAKRAKTEAKGSPPAPPPPPPQPTKEEKKLSGLQARLAALKEKLKKN